MSSKPTYKKEIALEYIEKYPNATTMAIARVMLKENPLDFKTLSSTRNIIREYRDGRRNHPSKRTEKEKKQAMSKFKTPKTDYTELKAYELPKAYKKVLFLSDIHLPYHDIGAVDIAVNKGIKEGIDAIYLNGDTIDMYQASRFIKDRRLRDLAGELELTREFLDELKTLNVPIYFKIGNHEERWENYLRLQAPELLGIPDFELSNVLRFGEKHIIEIKGRQMTKCGKLSLLHGHEFGHSVFSPVNPARGLYMRAKENSIIGHHHQTSEHSEKSLNGNVVTTWSVGCLCGLSPEYLPYNKWNHGFAIINKDESGDFEVDNHRIINGKIR